MLCKKCQQQKNKTNFSKKQQKKKSNNRTCLQCQSTHVEQDHTQSNFQEWLKTADIKTNNIEIIEESNVFRKICSTKIIPSNMVILSVPKKSFLCLEYDQHTEHDLLRSHSPSKHSFKGPGGIFRGLDLRSWQNICARELASVVSRGSPVVSRGLPLTTGRTIGLVPKFQIRHWGQNYNVKV